MIRFIIFFKPEIEGFSSSGVFAMFAEVFGIGMLSFDVVTKVVERFEILVTLAFDAVEPFQKEVVLLRQMFRMF